MLTLTYPGDWLTVAPDGETVKRRGHSALSCPTRALRAVLHGHSRTALSVLGCRSGPALDRWRHLPTCNLWAKSGYESA
jgi:hypothetical protein